MPTQKMGRKGKISLVEDGGNGANLNVGERNEK
jgi:hypothetical protein